ncbi:MAG: nicotinate (nicotinamide) nucleotide adenylyltransferase [Verrucomicrobiia bacterium]
MSSESRCRERIGILGGTFDPPHRAHLEMAKVAMSEVPLDWVAFVPARQSPHKATSGEAGPGDRAEMVRRAIEGCPGFRLVPWELHRPGLSFSVETARQFGERFPGAELFWIMGSDQWEVLETWREWEKLAEMVTFVVFPRPGPIRARDQVRWRSLDFRLDVASSGLREMILAGGPWKEWVSQPVADYILARGLYQHAS